MAERDPETEAAIRQLYVDALEIYETARREVLIERSDGRQQRYAAVRYKQQIERGFETDALVPTVAKIVKERTSGFDHLEQAGRPDLMLETLVLDKTKPYHRLFLPRTVKAAQDRMDDYRRRHPGHRP